CRNNYNPRSSARGVRPSMQSKADRTMRSNATPPASIRADAPRRHPSRMGRPASRSSRLRESAYAFYGMLEESVAIEDALLGTARAFGGEISNLLATGPARTVSSSILVGVPPRVLELEAEYLAINPRIVVGQGLAAGELSYDAS